MYCSCIWGGQLGSSQAPSGAYSCAGARWQWADDGLSCHDWSDLTPLLIVLILSLGLNRADLGMSLSWLSQTIWVRKIQTHKHLSVSCMPHAGQHSIGPKRAAQWNQRQGGRPLHDRGCGHTLSWRMGAFFFNLTQLSTFLLSCKFWHAIRNVCFNIYLIFLLFGIDSSNMVARENRGCFHWFIFFKISKITDLF